MTTKKRESEKDKLNRAMLCLNAICLVVEQGGEDKSILLGRIRSHAAYTLFRLGEPEQYQKLNKQLKLAFVAIEPGARSQEKP